VENQTWNKICQVMHKLKHNSTFLIKISAVNTLKSDQGIALFVAILVMAMVMLFLGASLLLSRVDTKITSNFKLGTQALQVADAGLQHALAVIGQGQDFDSILNCGTPPCDVISSTTFPPGSEFTYTVTVENDSVDINNSGSATDDTDQLVVLISTANGPNGSKRQIQAYVNRSSLNFTPPGAFYFPSNSASVGFDASANFFITGDDTDYDGVNPGPQPSITGLTTINDTVKDSFLSTLGSNRHDQIQGTGYSADPLTPSALTTSNVIDVNQIALEFYNHASAVKELNGLHINCSSSSPCVYGTDASPQITYIREGADHIHLDGSVTGSGVLVTEGKTHLYGNFEFHGLVISVKLGLTAGTDPGVVVANYFSMRNSAKVFGGVMLGPTNGDQGFEMKNNAKIYYSSDAITMANNLCGSCFPKQAKVSAWIDK